jgi:glyoxylase-like metal-dependent hydrolase (beta-lactamase superfamily II)/rhodanese-related sulfurtransferase
MIFRQLFDPQSSTYTYLLADSATREAVLIDPVFEHARRDAALIEELGLKLLWTLETHVHADHVTGASLLKRRFGSRIGLSENAGAEGADRKLAEGEAVQFGKRALEVRATPGHTGGCVTYVLDGHGMAFTGDALLIRGCGRTDFQEGSPNKLFRSVRDKVFSLPDACLLYPAHDYRGLTCSSVAEERMYNPRLAETIGEGDFVGYMNHLGLAHPKQMDIAVPANLRCGRPERDDVALNGGAEWAPLSYTFAGIWEIQPDWLAENAQRVQLIDVREPEEFDGALGHIKGAKLVPLGSLKSNLAGIDKERPVVVVCRSGARSAQATVILRGAGYTKVANLAGGMLRWRGQRLPVDGGTD